MLSLNHLIKMRKSKGREIEYTHLKMANYLLPSNNISKKQKQEIFSIRNRMIYTHKNFPNMHIDPHCICGELETNEHIYMCKYLNLKPKLKPYKHIFSNNICDVMAIYSIMQINLEQRM